MSGLFDIMNEIQEKQITKTETGDTRIFGVMIGIVTDNYNKDMPGRVCVSIPVRDKDANVLKWARIASLFSGKNWGSYFVPEVGDQVLLVFEQGNIEKPYVIGCVPKDNDKFLTKAVDKDNQIKRIITKNGNTIDFEDNKTGDGDKDKIKIMTSKQSHSIELDNENKKIVIQDKEKNCKVEMKTEQGTMNIIAKSSLVIEVGDNIKIKLNGTSGEVKIEATKFTVDATSKIMLSTNQLAKIAGGQTIIEASSILKASSSGSVQISGTPIKIG